MAASRRQLPLIAIFTRAIKLPKVVKQKILASTIKRNLFEPTGDLVEVATAVSVRCNPALGWPAPSVVKPSDVQSRHEEKVRAAILRVVPVRLHEDIVVQARVEGQIARPQARPAGIVQGCCPLTTV